MYYHSSILLYDICNGNQRVYHNTNILFFCYPVSLYNHAYVCNKLQYSPSCQCSPMIQPTVDVTLIFSPMLFYSTRIGIFAILYLRSVFSKYPHSIHDISAHCPYFPLSSNAILLSSSFYILLLSPSISYLLLLCTRTFIFY